LEGDGLSSGVSGGRAGRERVSEGCVIFSSSHLKNRRHHYERRGKIGAGMKEENEIQVPGGREREA
jgi:hypothetical protein